MPALTKHGPTLFIVTLLVGSGLTSEFPERECCDLPDEAEGVQYRAGLGGEFNPEHYDVHYQQPTDVLFVPSETAGLDAVDAVDVDLFDDNDFRLPEFIPELSSPDQHVTAFPTDTENDVKSTTGLNRPGNAMMNCLLAHELCTKDASCMSVKTVIRHICGPETVACSTTTVTKCQAGLRTLQAFPFFHPTCLCREPALDPHCNAFRDFLFDHPCMVAAQREADPYPIHALPTCTHALDVCRKDQSCVRMYEEFREQCKLRDGACRDREACHVAWRNLRMTPLFGCFCPSTQHKKCERLYAFIYNNTCVGGRCLHVSSAVVEHVERERDKRHAKSLVPPAPYGRAAGWSDVTVPPSEESRSFANNRPALPPSPPPPPPSMIDDDDNSTASTTAASLVTEASTKPSDAPDPTPMHSTSTSTDHVDGEHEGTFHDDDAAGAGGGWQLAGEQHEQHARHHHHQQQQYHQQEIETRLVMDGAGGGGGLGGGPIDLSETSHFVHSAFMNTRIGMANASVDGPAAASGAGNTLASPDETPPPGTTTSATSSSHSRVYSIYQSTCQRAMASCQSNLACRRQLEPMMRYCSGVHANQRLAGRETCHRDLCMQSVQGFYKDAPLNLTLEVAFCVCKKSTNKNDECLIAQERLHPDCARRPERYHPSGSPSLDAGHPDAPLTMPACHQLADECKNHPDCKPRLEFYVQACAVDTVTKGCAGLPSICRRAVLDILGTDLRTTCNCKSAQQHADVAAMYDCLEWQRLLWLNPCVVEAQRDYHKSQGNLKVVSVGPAAADPATSPSSPSTAGWWTTAGRQTTQPWYSTAEIDITLSTGRTSRPTSGDHERAETARATIGSAANRFTTSSTSAATETTVRPTTPAKMCTLERAVSSVYFAEGTSKRLYQEDDADCSELCRCDTGQRVTCAIVSCAERRPCQTSVAVYAHSATAFQAYRGECLCFSGSFVCAKPDPAHYSLPSGIFLFVGYSRADERAIYQITYQNVSRFLFSGVRRLMESKRDPESECRISVHDQIEENMIFKIELTTFDDHRLNNSVTLEMLTQEKAQCFPLANELKRMINKGLTEVREDGILSIIKVADVSATMPEPRRSSSAAHFNSPKTLCKLFVSLVMLGIASTVFS